MEQQDQRNLLLALVLCFGLFMLYNIFVLEPQQKAAAAAAKQQAQQNAVEQVTSPDARPSAARGNRARPNSPPASACDRRARRSMARSRCIGARIDDVSLKNFYDTIDDKEAKNPAGEIKLLSPDGTRPRLLRRPSPGPRPAATTDDVVWTQTSTGPLTPRQPAAS